MIANQSKFQLMFFGLNRQIHYDSLSLNPIFNGGGAKLHPPPINR